MTQLPTMPDGTKLSAIQISENPPRYVYGVTDTLEWVQAELIRARSQGMPGSQGWTPSWK